MKVLTLLIVLVLVLGCKKDKLENEFAILQGSWVWVGSDEIMTNKVSGNSTTSFYSSSQYSNIYEMEFERKGFLTLFENSELTKEYRVVTSLYKDNFCNDLNNCEYISLHLNGRDDRTMTIFMNEDTMRVASSHINMPLDAYQDNVSSYNYIHVFVRNN